jgi:hypothetical protein
MKTNYILSGIFLCLMHLGSAQNGDKLGLLTSNILALSANSNTAQKIAIDSTTLPFVEDFSRFYYSSIPNQVKFIDQFVYVNNELANNPPSIGFATFDGLNAAGLPYVVSSNPSSGNSIVSDYLTSVPFKWGTSNPKPIDSIYMSFFYKAKGLGDEPDKKDSLILEFKNVKTGIWKKIWSREGYSVPGSDTVFKFVMIPITDTVFLKKGFQFRFKNKSNASGSVDLWHVDYIYINKGRFAADVNPFIDVAYASKAFKPFKKYHAIPFQQYVGAADLNVKFTNKYKNLKRSGTGLIRIDSFNYWVKGPATSKNISGCDINILDEACAKVTSDTFKFVYPVALVNAGRKCFDFRHYISANSSTNPDFVNFKQNDTMYQKVCFDDYFAMDDGSAERAYFIDELNSGLIGRFDINKKDTLRGMDIFFLPVLYNTPTSTNEIRIKVYSESGGKPGTQLFEDTWKPTFFTGGYGKFIRYILSTKQVLEAGSYFIGFDQKNDSLQVGFDANTNNKDNFFYRSGSTWKNISYEGTPMIRAAFGDISVGLNAVSIEKKDWKIYPNPANNKVTIRHGIYGNVFNEEYTYELLNLLGQTVARENYRENNTNIDITELTEGFYFLKIFNKDKALQQSFKLQIKRE